jgi:pyruvate/2-oxoglutarate dehydrogenase complex dihydrolipoamide acyltransferase (E2) component
MSFHMSLRRKVAIASWSSPREGNIYGKMTIDMSNALLYIDYLREKSKERISVTHLIGRAAALAFKDCPDINGRIFLGKYYPHESVDMAFLVSLEGGKDLAKFKVSNMDQKSTAEIAKELRLGAERLRNGTDAEFERPKKLIKMLPTWIIRRILNITGYLTGCAGLDMGFLGLKKYPFGSCIITSVGMFGLDEGFAPPTPFARVPVYLTIPEVKKSAVIIDDKIVIRPTLALTATIDHRFLDGHRGAMVANVIRKFMEKPWTMDGIEEKALLSQKSHIDHSAAICENASVNSNKAIER